MKKLIKMRNNEVSTVINTLIKFKSRSDIVCVPSITMAAIRNIKILSEELKSIAECESTIKDKYFTDENSHVEKDENGNEVRVLNEDKKDLLLSNLVNDINELGNGILEVKLEVIDYKDFNHFLEKNKSNDSITPLEISILNLLTEEV